MKTPTGAIRKEKVRLLYSVASYLLWFEYLPSFSLSEVSPPDERLSLSPDDDMSFAKAMGLPEPREGGSQDDAEQDESAHPYALVLEDLHFYSVRALPSVCEVTDSSLQDKVLKKYYVKTLPPLRSVFLVFIQLFISIELTCWLSLSVIFV
jgi:hypothetical protein